MTAIISILSMVMTLTLICAVLDPIQQHISPTLLEHQFTSSTSIQNLKHNAQIIYERFVGLTESDKLSSKVWEVQSGPEIFSEGFEFAGDYVLVMDFDGIVHKISIETGLSVQVGI